MPTALELSREDWDQYAAAPARQERTDGPTQRERVERARLLHRVREAAAALKDRFGVERVVLFGSLAHHAWFVADSDVDLAVEGLPARDFWRAWRLAEDTIADRPVDLIDIETAPDSLRRAIDRYGVEL